MFLKKRRRNKLVLFLLILFLLSYFLVKQVQGSYFFKNRGRKIKVVFYQENPLIFSFGPETNYLIKFNDNFKIYVPGGFGYYRIGGLGKLSVLEKDQDLIRRSFSSAVSAIIDIYFYDCQGKIYYPDFKNKKKFFIPSAKNIFFYCSNSNLVDRVIFFIRSRRDTLKEITIPRTFIVKESFDREVFFKEYQGLFYQEDFRQAEKTIQILYHKSFKTALLISQILEGEGMIVSDIDQKNFDYKTKCLIIENQDKPSYIAKKLSEIFGCDFKKDQTQISDIILFLGQLEKRWEIN